MADARLYSRFFSVSSRCCLRRHVSPRSASSSRPRRWPAVSAQPAEDRETSGGTGASGLLVFSRLNAPVALHLQPGKGFSSRQLICLFSRWTGDRWPTAGLGGKASSVPTHKPRITGGVTRGALVTGMAGDHDHPVGSPHRTWSWSLTGSQKLKIQKQWKGFPAPPQCSSRL